MVRRYVATVYVKKTQQTETEHARTCCL